MYNVPMSIAVIFIGFEFRAATLDAHTIYSTDPANKQYFNPNIRNFPVLPNDELILLLNTAYENEELYTFSLITDNDLQSANDMPANLVILVNNGKKWQLLDATEGFEIQGYEDADRRLRILYNGEQYEVLLISDTIADIFEELAQLIPEDNMSEAYQIRREYATVYTLDDLSALLANK